MPAHTPPREAKRLLAAFMHEQRLPFTRLTARTVDFTDLARDYAVFVTVHGWTPHRRWSEVAAFAKAHGFIADARPE